MSKNTPKADINFEQDLWKAADELRGVAAGKTRKETEKLIYEAIKFHIDGMEQEGLKVPEPISEAETFVFT